ncbi:peptidoglycan-binding protein [Paracoccus sanguinis]|uniref:peptidoglycan-binding protein n=1 Tax=Paracoccus sanguinis TaxID=1545044 RepID=UPI0012E01A4F|nr:peptidoglycan-binding protein [Paracoccus sanguinis]
MTAKISTRARAALTLGATIGASAAALALGVGMAAAEPRAVVVGNSDYAELPDVAAVSLGPALRTLKASGYRVVEGDDLVAADLRAALSDLLRPDDRPGPRLVVFKGRFVHSRGETWFLGRDAGTVSLLSVGLTGVPLSVVTEAIEGGDPQAILMLGTDQKPFATGPGLRPGWGHIAARPGVTVIAGYTDGIGRAAEVLARPDGTVAEALTAGPSLRVLAGGAAPVVAPPPGGQRPVVVPPSGGQPVVVTPPRPGQPVVVPGGGQPVVAPPDQIAAPGADEQAAWTRAKRANSVAAYREFLGKYPRSIYAGAARGRMEELEAAAVAPAPSGPAADEAALRLDRAQRAQIQRQLTLLTYDTGGIDGAFGGQTRAAITRFQRDSGVAATGYLTRAQIDLLGRSAAIRSRGLEAEARQRQEARDAADNRDWARMKGEGAAGAADYLARYPEGLHADAARKVLADAARAGAAATGSEGPAREADDRAWAQATRGDTAAAYRGYIDRYPRGRHTAEAEKRLARFRAQEAQDAAGEAALDLAPPVRLVVEQRLAAMGLDVGKVDGVFDGKTRGAIRRYQASRNLRATGYLNQSTAVRLLADTLIRQD